MENGEKCFRVLAHTPRMNIYLPYEGIPVVSEDVLSYLDWHEISQIDEQLKSSARQNKAGLSCRIDLIDYTKKTIFSIGHTIRDYMIVPNSRNLSQTMFSPVDSQKTYYSNSNLYTKDNFWLLDDTDHYMLDVSEIFEEHEDPKRNLADLSEHIRYIIGDVVKDFWF